MAKNKEEQTHLFSEPSVEYDLTLEEQARKEEYQEQWRQYLQDPEFRQILGFPSGDDEAISALSDPPYYTACPNPFLNEIIEEWQAERLEIQKTLDLLDEDDESDDSYHREPFAADVAEGRSGKIYNAHSYHTKVPPQAIMRYILHYSYPGDIVLDGFAGTGMTGIAGQLCDNKNEIQNLGYIVNDENIIDQKGDLFSKIGIRKVIVNDISPYASFIAANYCLPEKNDFKKNANNLIAEVEKEIGWLYETWHPNVNDQKRTRGIINYIIWSEVFICPNCSIEMSFWDMAVDHVKKQLQNEWVCPNCDILVSKSPSKDSAASKLERAYELFYDENIGEKVRQIKQIPAYINYSIGKNRFEKIPDQADIDLIEKISRQRIPFFFPCEKLNAGEKTNDPFNLGITHTHHFYTKRNLWTVATFFNYMDNLNITIRDKNKLRFLISSYNFSHSTKMSRVIFKGGGKKPVLTGYQSGTLYISSLPVEKNVINGIKKKINQINSAFSYIQGEHTIVTNQSATDLRNIPEKSIDYIFVDPPFGGNIMYSELNYLAEAWLGIYTNIKEEAITNKYHVKGLPQYQGLMEKSFSEFYRVLKPGRWITVEFHNTKNSVWNSIQEALLRACFVVADVRTFDKKQGTFNQVSATGSVKSDLIISAYKPRDQFVENFNKTAGHADGVWEFVRNHLAQLPIIVERDGILETIGERLAYLLFDRMIAFHIQRGVTIPISASEFYLGLSNKFILRDGMYFLPDQAPKYDKAWLKAESIQQLSLFVTDEKSSIQWIRQQLDPSTGGISQTYQDIQPKFLKQLQQARHEQLPELMEILEQNFLQDEQGRWYVPDPNKASDLEKIRNKTLLREFNQYLEGKKQLKQFRTEAVRAGFAEAWQRKDFNTIVKIAERLPERVLQEDPDLLMYYDNASLRVD